MREHFCMMTRDLVDAPSVIDVDDLRDVLLKRWLSIGKADRGMELTPVRRLDMHRVIARWRRIHRQAAKGANVLIYSGTGDLQRSGFSNAMVITNTYTPPHRIPSEIREGIDRSTRQEHPANHFE